MQDFEFLNNSLYTSPSISNCIFADVENVNVRTSLLFFCNWRIAAFTICSLIVCGGFTVTSASGERLFLSRQLVRMIDRCWCWNSTNWGKIAYQGFRKWFEWWHWICCRRLCWDVALHLRCCVHVRFFGSCGYLYSVFARGLYLCCGTFAQATFPSLAGVAHVAQWVADGSGARGITCPWHCSCSLQTRPKHVSMQEGNEMLHDRGIS